VIPQADFVYWLVAEKFAGIELVVV